MATTRKTGKAAAKKGSAKVVSKGTSGKVSLSGTCCKGGTGRLVK